MKKLLIGLFLLSSIAGFAQQTAEIPVNCRWYNGYEKILSTNEQGKKEILGIIYKNINLREFALKLKEIRLNGDVEALKRPLQKYSHSDQVKNIELELYIQGMDYEFADWHNGTYGISLEVVYKVGTEKKSIKVVPFKVYGSNEALPNVSLKSIVASIERLSAHEEPLMGLF